MTMNTKRTTTVIARRLKADAAIQKKGKWIASHSFAMTLTVIIFTSCVKDTIYNTPHPEHGRITLTTDWSARGEGIDIPGSHHVLTNGDDEGRQTFTAHTNDHPELFAPGTHRLHLWHDAAGITVSGNTASVASLSRAGGFVGNPDWFFSAAMDVEIEADKVHPVTATMQQQVRELTLVIAPTGGTTDKIESITGTLSGVAGTLDIDTGAHGTPSDVALTFTKITEGPDAGKWSATVRLLGVAGSEQTLTGAITFTDGSPAAVSLDSDLSATLSTFNADKKTPIALSGTVVETPTGVGFTASITGWNVINREGVIAD